MTRHKKQGDPYRLYLELSTADRVEALLQRFVDTFAPDLVDKPEELAIAWRRFPLSLLDDAIQSFGGEYAFYLLEGCDLQVLARNVQVVEYLADDNTPFYTLSELATHTCDFVEFLKQHGNYMIRYGLPPHCFRSCPWLYLQLGRTYDTRTTTSPFPSDQFWLRDTPNSTEQPFEWCRSQHCSHPKFEDLELTRLTPCSYTDADLLVGMTPAQATRLEEKRARVFQAKVRILEMLATAAERGDATDLWENSLSVLNEEFVPADVEFLLRMDRYYIGVDARNGVSGPPDPKWTPGGLTNLLEVICHFQAELNHGMLSRTKQAVPSPLLKALKGPNDTWDNHRWRLFAVYDHPDRPKLEAAIEKMSSLLDKKVSNFRDAFRDRLTDALKNDLKVAAKVYISPRYRDVLPALLQHVVRNHEAKLDRGELDVNPNGENIFCKGGDSWTIQFAGKLIAKPHAVGLFYIARLLSCPRRSFTASTLREMFNAWNANPNSRVRKEATRVNLQQSTRNGERSTNTLHDADDEPVEKVIDERTMRECKEKLAELRIDHQRALERGDEVAASDAKIDMEECEAYLQKAQGLGGKIRSSKNEPKKVYDAVTNAINRVLEDLNEAHPALGEHLRQFIDRRNHQYCYSPNPAIDWRVGNG